MTDDDRSQYPGFQYYPSAFEEEPFKLGKKIAGDDDFYRTFVQYILSVVADLLQLVHFRAAIISELMRSAQVNVFVSGGQALMHQFTWSALSLATDRYFADVASQYRWNAELQEQLRSQWYGFMAPAFNPSDSNRRLDIPDLKKWRDQLVTFRRLDAGPLPACELCTAKCQYHYEAGWFTRDQKLQSEFQECVVRDDVSASGSIAWFSRLLTRRLLGKDQADLSYCIAVHLLENLEASLPTSAVSKDVARQIRQLLEPCPAGSDSPKARNGPQSVREKALEAIVGKALAGVPWQQASRQIMEKNDIASEDVDAELHSRMASFVDLFGCTGRSSAAVLSGRGIRALVLETLARQAQAGVPWREVSASTVRCFNITQQEVDTEIQRRQVRTGGEQ